jgi:asparagine synthase (glutamine-hydrolysing)
VVALMARQMRQPVKTFSIGFREARYSELSDARRVADHLATEHHELVVEPDATALVERLVWHLDEPFADASALPTYLVSELAGRQVKMVLSGDGGDEAFAGYDRYLRLLALERLGALRGSAASALRLAGRCLPGRAGFRLRRIGERLGLPVADRYLSGVALSRPEQTLALIGEAGREGYAGLHHLFKPDDSRPLLDRIVEVDLHSYLPDDILVKLDRMSMAASIEGRAPLLDHRVVEFALRLPVAMRVRDGRGKHLLRQVARRWLPGDVLDKPKQGFSIPLDEWFRGPLGGMAADLFNSRSFRERGWVRPSAAEDLLRRHRAGGENHAESLWQILCLELWGRQFVDSHGGA